MSKYFESLSRNNFSLEAERNSDSAKSAIFTDWVLGIFILNTSLFFSRKINIECAVLGAQATKYSLLIKIKNDHRTCPARPV